MSDEERAKMIVREVFNYDLKGEIGRLARLSVPLSDRQEIAKRLLRHFSYIREAERNTERDEHRTLHSINEERRIAAE